MTPPSLLKVRSILRQTANKFAADFRLGGGDLQGSSLSFQQGQQELVPADLQLFLSGASLSLLIFGDNADAPL